MSILKVRDLGKVGVITDVDPYDLPLGAWSFAVNARFVNNRIIRAPVWRNADSISADPRYVFATNGSDGTDDIYICYKSGEVFQWTSAAEANYSLSGYVASSTEATWTSCSLATVAYVNRSDRTPWGLLPSASQFTQITDWDVNWSAKILRAYNSALIALNVTKSGTHYPTLVKTSDIVTDPGVMPADWDHTDPSNNAVENPLTEMKGAIVDACVLGEALIIYGTSQNVVMRANGSEDVYAFDPLPFGGGAINANCSVEVDGKHYVFGSTDIYMHDGISKINLGEGRVREHVYGTMNASKASRFFVQYNPNTKEIAFCYNGTDEHLAFQPGDGCNRAAVLHVPSMTWSFDDLPYVHAAALASITIDAVTWATVTADWSTVGGSWQDLEDGFKKASIFVGSVSATYGFGDTLYAHDLYGKGSLVAAGVDESATASMTLQREGIDLDEVNVELRGVKQIICMYPQGRIDPDGALLEFAFGVGMNFGETASYTDYQTYDPTIDTKLDFDESGRFLALKVRYDDYKTVSLSGLDLDVEVLSDG